MKLREMMATLGIVAVLVAACRTLTSPTVTRTPVPLTALTPGLTQYNVGEATIRAQTELAPTFSAMAATQWVIDSTRAVWTSTPVTPAAALSPIPTASPPTTTPDAEQQFSTITMFDTMQGWASGYVGTYPYSWVPKTWRTVDGGLTWQSITPAEGEVRLRFAISGQVAWVTVCTPAGPDCSEELLRTLDGGVTWEKMDSPYRWFNERTHFFNEQDGYIYTYDVAAGSGFYNFRETHDGGETWKSIAFVNSHQGEPFDDFPWGYSVCNICGDALYLDYERIVVVGGGDPIGVTPVWVSPDRGATWHRTNIDNPATVDSSSWEEPSSLILLPDNSLLLTIKLMNNLYSEFAVAFYISDDGGFTWTYLSIVQIPPYTRIRVDAPTNDDVFMTCGEDLCVSHDGARTWQQLDSSLSFDPNGLEPFVRTFQFVDAHHGWALVEEEPYSLWRTMDGGVTWTMLDPVLLP